MKAQELPNRASITLLAGLGVEAGRPARPCRILPSVASRASISATGAFARAIAAVDDKPLLVVLNSCHSAATSLARPAAPPVEF
jgi:hypothetical protein